MPWLLIYIGVYLWLMIFHPWIFITLGTILGVVMVWFIYRLMVEPYDDK